MHRLLLIAAALSLVAVPVTAAAQPPWPATTPGSHIHSVQPPLTFTEPPRRITPRAASAETGQQRPQRSGAARGTPSPWTAFASLAVIVGLILAAARLWKTHGPALGGGLPADALEILGTRPLDRRHAIQLVRCGSRILVLGVTEEGLRTLAEISDPAEVDDLTALCRRAEADQERAPGLFGRARRSQPATTGGEPLFRGRVDEVLAERFPPDATSAGTAGRPAHA